ncbi:MAG: HAD-IIA family hydrolase [Magnetococcales bacterium]|nr:HAD-IIA family hydrolase [Magnetococcales bacterium]
MSNKPRIQDQNELTPYYARYRESMCALDPTLSQSLKARQMTRVDRFLDLSQQFDLILFDAFGVLNRGPGAIPGASESLAQLQKNGKPFLVVSNNASQAPLRLEKKYSGLGFSLPAEMIITSGMAVKPYVATSPYRDKPYFLVGSPDSRDAYGPDATHLMVNHPDSSRSLTEAEYILFCSNRDYYGKDQEQQLESLLAEKKCPILLANPDLVAPNSADGIEVVAGYTAACLVDRFDLPLIGLGKPFSPIYQLALEHTPGFSPKRTLMVGDTLDTDILGGAAMGFATCLTLSGVYAGQEDQLEALCGIRGIRPDYVVASIAP